MAGRTQPTRLRLPQRIIDAEMQGRDGGSQQEMVIVDPRWVGAIGAAGSYPPPTGDPDQNYAVTKIGNQAGYTYPGPPTLTSPLSSSTTYTSIPVSPLGGPLYQGQVVVLVSGGSGGLVQAWTVDVAGAAAGATSIPVVSQAASANFPAGTIVSGAAAQVPGFGIAMWRQAQVLTAQLNNGSTYTSIACTSFLPAGAEALSGVVVPAGTQITVIQPGPIPAVSQTWNLSSAVNAASAVTSLPVSSQAAQATFPIGSTIGLWLPL